MTRVSFEAELQGEKELARFFEVTQDILVDFKSIFRHWGDEFRQTMHGVFAGEGAFEGRSRWEALSPRYKQWKDAMAPGQPILVLTGEMRASLTQEGHGAHIFDYNEEEMKIGTSDEKAQFHQHGTYKMPQRKLLEMTQPQKLRWVQLARQVTWEEIKEYENLLPQYR